MSDLILHAANLNNDFPPGSLPNLQAALEVGISRIEVDIIPLKDGDFALLHDPRLEKISESMGNVVDQDSPTIRSIRYKNHQVTFGTLAQAVPLLKNQSSLDFLQLDLKPYAPLTPACLMSLLDIIQPLRSAVLVSTVADWAVRLLRRLAPGLRLGFDPLLYLDIGSAETREVGVPPFRSGAYGYLDEHPLAAQRWGGLGDYFSARADALLQQVPAGTTWFINAQLLSDALQAGFNWIEYLHHARSQVDAWTLDMDRAETALHLSKAGVDYITSNQYHALRVVLEAGHPNSEDF